MHDKTHLRVVCIYINGRTQDDLLSIHVATKIIKAPRENVINEQDEQMSTYI